MSPVVQNSGSRHSSSFRDPSGFVFTRESHIFRQVNASYQSEIDSPNLLPFLNSQVEQGNLINFDVLGPEFGLSSEAIKVLRTEAIQTISYPYEWSFSQLKDAALLTLTLARKAIESGLVLKDASAYNVQFRGSKPVFIDLLSFEQYQEGTPWVAYKQFCQHFLAPLALMSKVDPSLGRLLQIHLDGIPLKLASKLLPWSTRLDFGILSHIHLHSQGTQQEAQLETKTVSVSKVGLFALLDNLLATVSRLTWKPANTEWGDYYSDTNYTRSAMDHKRDLVAKWIKSIEPKPVSCWDLGANTGAFSKISSDLNISTVAWDIDPAAVEKGYLALRETESSILPLVIDLSNPSPNIGWALQERESWIERGPVDLVMALALVHHLAIGNNTPLPNIANLLARVAKTVIIEFVPKEDSQVARMLASRKDIFGDYHLEGFRIAFSQYFEVEREAVIEGSHRTLFLLKRKS